MRITRLELRNFRCFESLDVELADTTVLVGANDSGKSAVLEAVHLLFSGTPLIDLDWLPRVLDHGGSLNERPPASIVGFVDLEGEALEAFGPSAPEGVVRLGVSSALSGRWIVLSQAELPALIDALDDESMRFEYGDVRRKDYLEIIREDELIADLDGRFWVRPDIWELALPTMGGWDLVDRGNELVTPIVLGGPHDTSWSPKSVVEPILRRLFSRTGGSDLALEKPTDGPADLGAQTGRAYSFIDDAVNRLLTLMSGQHEVALDASSGLESLKWRASVDLADAVIQALALDVRTAGSGRSTIVEAIGPGTRRSIAVAALNLYRDPELWPKRYAGKLGFPAHAVVLIEEPESGLHPAAQRALAQSMREWATYGLQLLLVTHSPAFVNVASPRGIRLARKTYGDGDAGSIKRTIVRPVDLDEIREELGIQPSDILLARRFVIVEGQSDQIVLDIWSRRFGLDLESEGVRLVPAHGHGLAGQVARFLGLAYEGAQFLVVLDNGSDTARQAKEIDSRFGGRVETVLLSRTAIEGFYHSEAIVAWLRSNGAQDEGLDAHVAQVLDEQGNPVRALGMLAERYLGRSLDKAQDGMAIANLTTEARIDPEIKELLMRIAT